jgi:uncharacterized protein YdaU (DUF1376 family)
MSNKKNLPNIPIYIGDWERDCNVLSLQAEAAWMRIVFKLWTKGKQNSIKIPAKALQNLWRSSEQKTQEILQELIDNDIADITVSSEFTEFICRRFVKENQLSEIRRSSAKKENGKENKSKTQAKDKQNVSKSLAKHKQNTDYDYDYENDIENENKDENKKRSTEEKQIKMPFHSENFLSSWQNWKVYKNKEFSFKYKSIQSEQAALISLSRASNGNEVDAIKIIMRSMENGWKGFFELKPETSNGRSNERKTLEERLRKTDEILNQLYG